MWTYFAVFFAILLLLGVFIKRVYLTLTFKEEAEKKNLEEEIEEYVEDVDKKKISRDDKKRIAELDAEAEDHVKAGNEDEAIKCLVQVLAIDAAHLEAKRKLAILYMHKEMYAQASALLKELAGFDEDSVHYSNLGLALYKQNLFEEAKEAYQKAVSLDPSRPQRFISLTQVYRSLELPSLAIIAVGKAIELEPANIDYLFLLADIYVEMGYEDEAKAILNFILEKEPENKMARELIRGMKAKKEAGEK